MNKKIVKIRSFTDLNAWRKGHELVLQIYKATDNYPRAERFNLISQSRRCAVSITSNIAEGFTRRSFKEKVYFYYAAVGSVVELQSQLMIARDLKYIKMTLYDNILDKSTTVHKLINGLIKSSKKIKYS
jgi:four helix bundle protein